MVNLRSLCDHMPHRKSSWTALFALSIWISKRSSTIQWNLTGGGDVPARLRIENQVLTNTSIVVFVYSTHWSFRIYIDKLSLEADIYTERFHLYTILIDTPILFIDDVNHPNNVNARPRIVCNFDSLDISKTIRISIEFSDSENFDFFIIFSQSNLYGNFVGRFSFPVLSIFIRAFHLFFFLL